MVSSGKKALILGATGGIGGEIGAALLRRGWSVVGMAREIGEEKIGGLTHLQGAAWVSGDAMNAGDVLSAAAGVDVIVHAVNPPGYKNWGGLVLPMIDNSIAAARATGARLVLPGTIYNYGPDAFPDLKEDSPQHPNTRKGQIRVELEQRLEAASGDGVPVLIVRYGDFFGPVAGGNWLSAIMVKPGAELAAITYPGDKGVGHSWAYLPDAGEVVGRLLERSDALETFARFHFEGTWDADGSQMITAIRAAVRRPHIKVKPLPWALLGIAGLFQETLRETWKMRYLWQRPVRLDNRKLVAFLGEEPRTPLVDAVRTTLQALQVS